MAIYGYNGTGTTTDGIGSGALFFEITAIGDDTISTATVYIRGDTESAMTCHVYNDSGYYIASTNSIGLTTSYAWRTMTFASPPTLTQGNTYYLGFTASEYSYIDIRYRSTGSAVSGKDTAYPIDMSIDISREYSLYFTYGGTSGPANIASVGGVSADDIGSIDTVSYEDITSINDVD